MKICILGFDGLEHGLVEEWNLKALKQDHYGRLEIPKECYIETMDFHGNRINEPWTPFVWAAFLTGKPPSSIGLTRETYVKWSNPMLNWLKRNRLFVGYGKLLRKIGFRKQSFRLAHSQTFLKSFDRPLIINFPLLSAWELKHPSNNFNEIIQTYQTSFSKSAEILFKKVNTNWDVILFYTRLLDVVGELDYHGLQESYQKINDFVRNTKVHLGKAIFLVVSDHGIEQFGKSKYGRHSDHAYYSINVDLQRNIDTILGLHDLIVKLKKEF